MACTYEEALQTVANDPKTLFYSWEGVLVDDETQRFQSQVYALKMDDATYSLNSFGLQGGDSIDILGDRPDYRPNHRPNHRPELVHELPLAVEVLRHGPDQLVTS